MRQVKKMLTQQTDNDLEGRIRIPRHLSRNDHLLYEELIHKARKLLVMHHETMSVEEILEQVGKTCEEWYADKVVADQR